MFKAGLYTGSIWVGGHAIECQLKLNICQTLDLQELPETFKVHDLEALLLHSGVQSKLHSNAGVETNFKSICGVWNSKVDVRYKSPATYGKEDAQLFLEWTEGTESGVIPWLRKTH